MKTWFIYVAVVVSGACVLAIEILGTRIIGPFYGVSLYLWSALIGVTLAALSLGYYVGCRWADRGPRLSRFCLLLALSGIWVVFIPWLKHPVLAVAEPLGLRFAVLFAAFVLFFPPLASLGMVSPYAIRLKATTIDTVGRTAGNLYAISTIASVVSAILTGFFFIPNVGVSRLTFLTGIVLVITAGIGLASTRRVGVLVPSIVLLLVGGTAGSRIAPVEHRNPDMGLLAIEHSAYGELRVVETAGYRYLLIDGGIHTIVDPESDDGNRRKPRGAPKGRFHATSFS
jgi:predicted membrane-bound spermidine synthase